MEVLFSKKQKTYTINCFDRTELVRRLEKNTSQLCVGDTFKVVFGTANWEKYQITKINPYNNATAVMIDFDFRLRKNK